MKQSDKAIFLHRINYSESSLIVTFYTLQHGIQKFIFQGGKKKAAALFPLSLCEITFYHRPDSDLGKLTEAQSYAMIQEIPLNPIKSTLAFFIVDVLKKCLQTDQSDPLLYQFLEKTIVELKENRDHSLFSTRFLLNFSHHLGIEPHLQETNKRFFHLEDGEFSDSERRGEIVSSGASVELIQSLMRKEVISDFSKQVKSEAFDVMIHYYKLHIPKFDIQKSLDVIKEILYN